MCFLYKYEYGNLKSVEIILKGKWHRRENNGGDEPNWSITYVYMKMLQQNLLKNYHTLIKTFK
jgi:hypothetical protein